MFQSVWRRGQPGAGGRDPSPTPPVVLYTRAGCCLCDEADSLLRRHGLTPQAVDIDSDPELSTRFTSCVPVVEIDGKIRFRGRVNEVLLRRLLASPPADT